ncbi:MAG TPA: DUF2079 domain-containing protein [Microthrixaceae bacterium]|nr:DUF2079 domain-containing protein [Microthrixaceae bacterium]
MRVTERPRDGRILRDQLPLVVLAVVVVAYTALFLWLSWARHDRFATWDYDLGMYDQGIWQLSHGRGFMTVRGMHVFGHHANLGFLLLTPAYWLGAGPQFLDVVNVLAVVAVAWPVYLLGRHHLSARWAGTLLVIAYLFHFSPQWKMQETFHAESLAAPFLVGAWYLAVVGRWRWYWWCVVGALIWKEDVALAVIGLGLAVAILCHDRRRGALTVLAGVGWFLVATQVFMPMFQESGAVYDNLFGPLGSDMGEVAWNSVRHPSMLSGALAEHGALGGAADLMAPFGFTGLLAPLLLLIGAPQHVVNFASEQYFTWDLRWHYAFIPFLAVLLASIRAIVVVRRAVLGWCVVGAMLIGVTLTLDRGVGPWAPENYEAWWPSDDASRSAEIRRLMAMVPDDSVVSTLYYLVPHLSQRIGIFTFPNPWISSNYGVDGVPAPPDPMVVDHLLVSESDLCSADDGDAGEDEAACGLFRSIVESDEFVTVAGDGDLVLMERRR